MAITSLLWFLVLTNGWIHVSFAQVSEPWIVHTNLRTIDRLDIGTWTNTTVVDGLSAAVAVDFHFSQGYLYWSDQTVDTISRMNLSDPDKKEVIISGNMELADGIAVDWINNHIYWVDAQHDHIMVSNLDGKFRKTLINTYLEYPRAIVVYPSKGWLFFTDVNRPKIERCGLDGSNRETIVNTNIDNPNGLSLDFSTDRMYWLDSSRGEIRSSTLHGTDIRVLVTASVYISGAWGLIVFQNWIYWTSFVNNTIFRVDKQTGTNYETIKTDLKQPVGIKIYSSENQPAGVNLCGINNGYCEHLCLATPQSSFRCTCADSFQLKSDERGCLYSGSGYWVTFANLYTIERIDISSKVTQTIATGLTNAVDLDIHYKKGYVYWTDVVEKKIYRSSVTIESVSGVKEEIVSETVDVPDGLAIDWVYDLLYWTDTGHNHIQVSRLDGTYRKTIIKDNSLEQPRAIVVYSKKGLLFFSEWGSQPRIERCRMDGHDRKIIISTDIVWPNGMALDYVSERLYWIDGKLNQIKSTRFDGTDTYTVIKNDMVLPKPFDLVIHNSYIYWSNWQNKTICRVNKYTGGDFMVFANYMRSPMGIQVFGNNTQPKGDNVCGQNNGGCSHICFPSAVHDTSKSITSECMCPDNYYMKTDNKTCIRLGTLRDIKISTTSSGVGISWSFPATTDTITQIDLKIYDKSLNLVYTRGLYYPQTSHIITASIIKTCEQYTVKMRCEYRTHGWSAYSQLKFWPTENVINTELGTSVIMSWNTTVSRSDVDVLFEKQLGKDIKLIIRNGTPTDSSKYYSYAQIGLNVRFTVSQVSTDDVGLYKSSPTTNWTVVDGCALLALPAETKIPTTTTTTTKTTTTSPTTKTTTTTTTPKTSITTMTTPTKTKANATPASIQTMSTTPPRKIAETTSSIRPEISTTVSNNDITKNSPDPRGPDDKAISTREVAVYSSLASVLVTIVIIVIVLFCRRQQRNRQIPKRHNRKQHEQVPDVRMSNISAVYNTINDDSMLVNSEYLDPVSINPYLTMNSSRTHPKGLYSDLQQAQAPRIGHNGINNYVLERGETAS